jgi:rubredoxin
MEMICLYCQEPLTFDPRRGWIHPEGGTYMSRCRICGWRGAPHPTPERCPRCGGEVLDDHCVRPARSLGRER